MAHDDFLPLDTEPPGNHSTQSEDAIFNALQQLAGVDTSDTNLCHHSKAWEIMEELAAHIYNEGRVDQREVDAKLIDSLASHVRLELN